MTVARPLPQTALREATDRQLLDETIRQGRMTRAELADATGYSRPTVSEAVRRMVSAGLLDAAGPKETGRRGRIGTFYELGARAGWVLALEVAQAGVHWRAADLAGRALAEDRRPPSAPGDVESLTASLRAAVCEAIAEIGASPAAGQTVASQAGGADGASASAGPQPAAGGAGPLWAVGASIANPVDPATRETVPLSGTPFPEGLVSPAAMIADLVQAPVLVDNDVNLAALAEYQAAKAGSFAYVYIGAGLGVGLYIGDQLIRGAHGLAGEIGYLPGVISPTLAGDLAAGGLGRSDAPSNDVAALLDLLDRFAGETPSEADDRAVRCLIDAVGRAIISVAAVVDPELVLLGGPVGTHPALLSPVRGMITNAFPGPTRIDHGALGPHAALHGALQLALEHARAAAISVASTG